MTDPLHHISISFGNQWLCLSLRRFQVELLRSNPLQTATELEPASRQTD